ncbi:MAG TPA: hypothetical protein VFG53_08300 [Anaeromyxobacter sp.]|nr:hypothetical protein [Anaeromyxobacter sp.]
MSLTCGRVATFTRAGGQHAEAVVGGEACYFVGGAPALRRALRGTSQGLAVEVI